MSGELLSGADVDWDFIARQSFPLELATATTGRLTTTRPTVTRTPNQDTPRRTLIAAGRWRRP